MILSLKILLRNIPKITLPYAKILEKLGLLTVEDLLFYFPFRYDDFSKIVPIDAKFAGQVVTVEGKVAKAKLTRIFRRRMTISEIIIQDKNNIPLKAVWFNQPYVLDSLKEETLARLSGKLTAGKKFLEMSNPSWEKASRDTTNTGRLVPVYGETRGLTSKWLRWQLKMLLDKIGRPMSLGRFGRKTSDVLSDPLPPETRKRLNLYDLHTAIREIHFPENREKL